MLLEPHKLQGVYILNLKRMVDPRGYLMRFYSREILAAHNLQTAWEEESLSFNKEKNTVRGLHFQLPPHDETKIVRVVRGAILDVFVDLRRASGTFGEWGSIELSAESDTAVYIPKGFAHGFKTLSDNTVIEYKIDANYNAAAAAGIRWDDSELAINWEISNPIMSERDRGLPLFADFDSPF